jgi:hypothetical protein
VPEASSSTIVGVQVRRMARHAHINTVLVLHHDHRRMVVHHEVGRFAVDVRVHERSDESG